MHIAICLVYPQFPTHRVRSCRFYEITRRITKRILGIVRPLCCLLSHIFMSKMHYLYNRPLVESKSVRVSFLGRTEMLPLPIQTAISEVHEKTRNHNRYGCVLPQSGRLIIIIYSRFMNVYIVYTSAEEITSSVEACTNASIVGARR